MIEKGKAPRGATNTAKGNEDVFVLSAPRNQYNTSETADASGKTAEFTARIEALMALLPTGAENPIPSEKLAAMLGVTERELRRRVSAGRLQGAPILSSRDVKRGGYFRPASPDELERFLRSREVSARRSLGACARMRRAAQVSGQAVIDDGGRRRDDRQAD